MDALISVIVPIYKVEAYLPRCLDSIVNQTYRNLEIILVDDGSPDGCGAICDESYVPPEFSASCFQITIHMIPLLPGTDFTEDRLTCF